MFLSSLVLTAYIRQQTRDRIEIMQSQRVPSCHVSRKCENEVQIIFPFCIT
jgi:hypothetical protein